MAIFNKSFKKDLDTFEYSKKYIPELDMWVDRNDPQEHKWDRLASGEETKKFYEAKERINMSRVKRNRVQSNPETTGQHSPID